MPRLHDLSFVAQIDGLRSGEFSPAELTSHYLDRIDRHRGLGAFSEVTRDAALRRAADLPRPADGSLWGVPLADKDLVARAGVPTRYGSRSRMNHVPAASDPLAAALDAAGAINVGKTSTSEFGLTGFTEPLIHDPARDPWRPAAGAGGSSGGAAVAVAAGLLPAAVGSDGGGSIRIPSATVGVVGLKPSRGRLPIGSGFDSPDGLSVTGPIARSVEDAVSFSTPSSVSPPSRTRQPRPAPALRRRRAPRPRSTAPRDHHRLAVGRRRGHRPRRRRARRLRHRRRLARRRRTRGDGCRLASIGYAELFHVLWRASAARIPLSDADAELVEPLTAWLVQEGRRLSALELLGGLAAARAFERRTIADFSAFDAVLTPALAQPPQPIGSYAGHSPERTFAMQVEYAPYSSFVNVAGLPALTCR